MFAEEFVKAPVDPTPFRVNELVLVITVPYKSIAAPDDTVTALDEAPNAVALLTCNVPEATRVPPVYRLLPASVSVPAPEPIVIEPAPLITPDNFNEALDAY